MAFFLFFFGLFVFSFFCYLIIVCVSSCLVLLLFPLHQVIRNKFAMKIVAGIKTVAVTIPMNLSIDCNRLKFACLIFFSRCIEITEFFRIIIGDSFGWFQFLNFFLVVFCFICSGIWTHAQRRNVSIRKMSFQKTRLSFE